MAFEFVIAVTSARHEIFDPENSNYYHCISRCVRRAFLCGEDPYSGKSYEHRRAWTKARLRFLVEIFAIELAAYAVMSNHLHTILRNRPDLAAGWSAEEVARRWLTLFPRRKEKGRTLEPNTTEIHSITVQPELVKKYQKRLSNLSWFQRCLNEYIARKGNAEDGCKGRFWEGRFKSIRLEDTAAVIACCVYVDLNPIRAGMARTPEESDYTSIQDRLREFQGGRDTSAKPNSLGPRLLSVEELSGGAVTTAEYLKLVDWTGRVAVGGKASMSEELPILERLRLQPKQWCRLTVKRQHLFRRIMGTVEDLRRVAEAMGRRWFQGLAVAREVFAT